MPGALVLGGAGFIGSAICRHLASCGFKVLAVDGLLPRTSGAAANLPPGLKNMELVARRVEDVAELPGLLRGYDLIVDAMGWTCHWEAIEDPFYDLELNLASHLAVIRALGKKVSGRIVYLGSSHQYGRAGVGPIGETQAMVPLDVQSVHKVAAESHYRLAAERLGLSVVSLRFGNTFGPGQPLTGRDIGLIGAMIRQALAGEAIQVFGEGRRRTVHFAPDLGKAVERVMEAKFSGFTPLNVPGQHVLIGELAKRIVACTGGTVRLEAVPAAVSAIDTGNVPLDCALFEKHCGPPQVTKLAEAVALTIEDARRRQSPKTVLG